MSDVIVIGAGLFGATITRSLRHAGFTVDVFDCREPLAASPCSGSLMKPSWFDGLGKEVYEPALAELAHLYKIRELEFTIAPKLFTSKVLWIPTHEILALEGVIAERVLDIREGFIRTEGCGLGYVEHEAPVVIVAAGYWCRKLLAEAPEVEGKQGVSFRWPGLTTENVINPWAPYKQMVKFQEGNGVWAGDGTAILADNWTAERRNKSYERVVKFVGGGIPDSYVGIRPYVPKAKPAFVEQVRPGVWVATGGAKNGLIAAGWAARKIRRHLSGLAF